jgi:hypothetical protein
METPPILNFMKFNSSIFLLLAVLVWYLRNRYLIQNPEDLLLLFLLRDLFFNLSLLSL